MKDDPRFAHHKQAIEGIQDLIQAISSKVLPHGILCTLNHYGDGSVILMPIDGDVVVIDEDDGTIQANRSLRYAFEDLGKLETALRGYLLILPALPEASRIKLFWDSITGTA